MWQGIRNRDYCGCESGMPHSQRSGSVCERPLLPNRLCRPCQRNSLIYSLDKGLISVADLPAFLPRAVRLRSGQKWNLPPAQGFGQDGESRR